MRTRHEIVSVLVLVAMLAIGFIPDNALADQEGWIVQFGTPLRDVVQGIAVSGHDVYVAGVTGGTLPGQTSAGSGDSYVRQFNSRGELQ